MTIYRAIDGVNRTIKQQFRGLGGVNREVKEQYRGLAGINRKVFQNRNGQLYEAGGEFISVTGGWKIGYSYSSGSQQKTASYLECITTGSASPRRSYQTINKINVTNFTKLNFDFELIGNAWSIFCGFLTDMSNYNNAPIYGEYQSTGRRTVSLDVSAITGDYYIAVFSNSNNTSNTTRVYKVWLE